MICAYALPCNRQWLVSVSRKVIAVISSLGAFRMAENIGWSMAGFLTPPFCCNITSGMKPVDSLMSRVQAHTTE